MVSPRASSAVVTVALVSLSVAIAATSCRCNETGGERDAGGDAREAPDDRDEAGGDGALFEAGGRFLDASPKVDIDPDGPVDPACTGPEVSFALAVVDRRCAIGSARAKALRAALERDSGAPLGLRQEAKVDPDGRVSLRLVNTGAGAVALPLSWSARLPSFTILAEDERHAVFELTPARFEPAGAVAGLDASAANDRAHFARIVLAPGSAAVATLHVEPTVAKVLRRAGDAGAEACADGGGCERSRLAKGSYVLHIGELLTDVEAGPPARVTWLVP
jgi:hypothetical protein